MPSSFRRDAESPSRAGVGTRDACATQFDHATPLARRLIPRWRRQLPRHAVDRAARSANLHEREDREQFFRPALHVTAERRMNTSRLCPLWGKRSHFQKEIWARARSSIRLVQWFWKTGDYSYVPRT